MEINCKYCPKTMGPATASLTDAPASCHKGDRRNAVLFGDNRK